MEKSFSLWQCVQTHKPLRLHNNVSVPTFHLFFIKKFPYNQLLDQKSLIGGECMQVTASPRQFSLLKH